MSLGFGLGLEYSKLSGGGSGFDSDYQAVLDKGIANGNIAPTSTNAGNQLMIDLKDSGAFAKADALGVLASGGGSDSGFALIDWKRLINLTAVNSPTFNDTQGFTGNGTSSYISIGYIIDATPTNIIISTLTPAYIVVYSFSPITHNYYICIPPK